MTNTRLDAAFSGASALLMACLGCTSLHDLASYSAGSPDAGAPATALSPTSAASAEPAPNAPDAGAGDTPAAEQQDPANVALAPTDAVVAADDCAGPQEFPRPDGASCYLLSNVTTPWDDANELCEAWGGGLAQVGSLDEHAFLGEHSEQDAWLGANDVDDEGTFRWLDGDVLDADAPWGASQPDDFDNDEDCLELRGMEDDWNDVPCTSGKVALCERTLESDGTP